MHVLHLQARAQGLGDEEATQQAANGWTRLDSGNA
jgi:hypothetical protein